MNELSNSLKPYCLAKPDAYEDHPWGETVIKVAPKGKIFCFLGDGTITVRATLDEQAALTQLGGIVPAPYLARYGWVQVSLSEGENLGLAEDLIDRSYELVIGPKRAAKMAAR